MLGRYSYQTPCDPRAPLRIRSFISLETAFLSQLVHFSLISSTLSSRLHTFHMVLFQRLVLLPRASSESSHGLLTIEQRFLEYKAFPLL